MSRFIDVEFLKEITNLPSPTGWEQPVQRVIRERMNKIGAKVETDVLGNVISTINEEGGPSIMLAGHVDEVALQVRYINKEGYIYFHMLGGVDAHLTPGKRVYILAKDKKILGVIGKKAIHLQKPKERETVVKLTDQFIDVGASSKEDVENMGIRIGDPIIFEGDFQILGDNGLVISRCFDDKVGAFIVNEIARKLADKSINATVHAVSTIQEEIGTVGAGTAAFHLKPDLAIAFDVTFASDSPDVNEKEFGRIKLGGGPVVARGPNINQVLFDFIVETAKELEIPLQFLAAPRQTGTDARAIYQSRGGVATALISIPNRYMHSMSEVVHLDDVEMIVNLVAKLIEKLTPDMSFIPE